MPDVLTPTPLPAADLAGLFRALDPPPFALVRRAAPDGTTAGPFDVFIGTMDTVRRVTDLPLGPAVPGGGPHTLALLPYRCLAERGLDCHDDGTPLRVLRIRRRHTADHAALTAALPAVRPAGDLLGEGAGFDGSDEDYADLVRDLMVDEVARTGLHVLIRRDFTARLPGHGPAMVGELFRRLLAVEHGAYWTFAVYTGGPHGAALAGASPQGHVTLRNGRVVMRPMCGMLRLPPGGRPSAADLVAFLRDGKESEELGAVVDAELAMLCRISEGDVRLEGPRLRPMARVLHTECRISATAALPARHTLAGSLFAATAVGRPFADACRVITRREPTGRGYYGGLIALLGHDDAGNEELETAVLIRTFEVSGQGRLKLSVGATLGPRSVAADETAETRAKASALVSALASGGPTAGGGAGGHARAGRGRAPEAAGGPATGEGGGVPGDRTRHQQGSGRQPTSPAELAWCPSVTAEGGAGGHAWAGRGRAPEAAGGPATGEGGGVPGDRTRHQQASGRRPTSPADPAWCPSVTAELDRRRAHLSAYWQRPRRPGSRPAPRPPVLLVDTGGEETAPLAAMLRGLGRTVDVRPAYPAAAAPRTVAPGTTVVLGPGPGDPLAHGDDRITALRAMTSALLSSGAPTFGVGLGFHLLLAELGLVGAARARDGATGQREIEVFGRRATVGYGGTRTVVAGPHTDTLARRLSLTLCYGPAHGELVAMRGPRTGGVAFLPASVLSVEGAELLDVLLP
ncbi:chorismate-binding protein [Streptomyces sp. NRRL WC-3725]|uniref:chorismate-binding protein n=1 Tax=Streptomyces sp. NRRL WC-3725 TaxID=1463933 RepID=UPI000690456D|nr:chorismate-binding protein [Streptomyces sp. NRRL WC-3725]